jgi:hypothetical protein
VTNRTAGWPPPGASASVCFEHDTSGKRATACRRPRDFLKAALAAPHVTLPVCVLLGVSLFAAGLLFVLRVAGVP